MTTQAHYPQDLFYGNRPLEIRFTSGRGSAGVLPFNNRTLHLADKDFTSGTYEAGSLLAAFCKEHCLTSRRSRHAPCPASFRSISSVRRTTKVSLGSRRTRSSTSSSSIEPRRRGSSRRGLGWVARQLNRPDALSANPTSVGHTAAMPVVVACPGGQRLAAGQGPAPLFSSSPTSQASGGQIGAGLGRLNRDPRRGGSALFGRNPDDPAGRRIRTRARVRNVIKETKKRPLGRSCPGGRLPSFSELYWPFVALFGLRPRRACFCPLLARSSTSLALTSSTTCPRRASE
jgi:hypothetical protein